MQSASVGRGLIALFLIALALPAAAKNSRQVERASDPQSASRNHHEAAYQVWPWPASWQAQGSTLVAQQKTSNACDNPEPNSKPKQTEGADDYTRRGTEAAEVQAYYSTWQFYVGVGSAVIGALAAAFTYWAARAAADATKIARGIVEAVDRPYLCVEIVDQNFGGVEAPQNYIGVRYRIKNIGGSPAQIELLHDSLKFEEPGKEDNWLGGSNIFIVEKGDATPTLCAYGNVDANAFRNQLLSGNALIFRVNFSFVDLMGVRRNHYFVKAYQCPPFDRWHWNSPPRIEEVPLDPYKWRRRIDSARLRLIIWKEKLLGKPKEPE